MQFLESGHRNRSARCRAWPTARENLGGAEAAPQPERRHSSTQQAASDHQDDLRDVNDRSEMARSRVCGVVPRNGNRERTESFPCRVDQDLAFESKSTAAHPLQCDVHHLLRVDPEARLGIGDGVARCPRNPETCEAICTVSGRRKLRSVMQARADHDSIAVSIPGVKEARRVDRIMLTIAVQGDDASCVMGERVPEGRPQARRLAFVRLMAEQRDGQAIEFRTSPVGRAVIDDNDARAERQRSLRQRANRSGFVEGGDRDPDAVPMLRGRKWVHT